MLAILAGFALERFLNNIDRFRTYQWFTLFMQQVQQRFGHKHYWSDTLGVLIILLIPTIAIAIAHQALAEQFTLVGFLFSIAVLLYCFGPTDLHEAARLFIEARKHDDQHSAKQYATEILGNTIPEEDSLLFGNISRALLVDTNERLLAVFFWFVILGPMGAILYRLTCVMVRDTGQDHKPDTTGHQHPSGDGFHHTVRLLYAILNWAPAHLTALCYAIIGSFVDALHEWKKYKSADFLDPDQSDNMMIHTGLGSLRMDADSITFDEFSLRHILDLSNRTTIVWLTALALITMAGWTV